MGTLRVLGNLAAAALWAVPCTGLVLGARLLGGSRLEAYRAFRFWARSTCWLCGIDVQVEDPPPSSDEGSVLYLCNHATGLDPLLLMGAIPEPFSAVAKKELKRVPVVGWTAWASGWVFIDRGDRGSAQRSLAQMAAALRSGRSLLIFPEGRRTDQPRALQSLKKGPFHLALDAQVPIQPLVILGWEKLLPGRSLVPRPGVLRVRFGPRLQVQPDDSVGGLLERVENEMYRLMRSKGETMESLPLPHEKFRQWSLDTPDAPALYERGEQEWEPISWKTYHQRACQVGSALLAMGHEPGQCVVILSGNRAEWLYCQYGITMAGGVVAPCYQTNPHDMVAYLVGHCQARTVFVEDAAQLAKLIKVRGELPRLRWVVVFDGQGVSELEGASEDWVMDFGSFMARADAAHDARRDDCTAAIDPDSDSFIIYTSGTTGLPKAVALSHKNLAFGGPAVISHYPVQTTRCISYLPLCHIAEQTATNLVQLETGGEVYLCREFAKLSTYLREVRPNSLFGVPRVWEKVEAVLQAQFAAQQGMQRKLLDWARGVESAAFEHKRRTGEEKRSLSRWLANRLVLVKIHRKMGMENIIHVLTGAAPISDSTLRFFASIGFHIQEVYGLSETAGILTATLPSEVATGTVGRPMKGVEIEIADDGEILARGPGLCRGYLHDEAATAELWEDGRMHTGDIGSFDERGNLRITDRKKDLIITAQAKNIAPQPIEAGLKRIPGISQTAVIGDRRKYLVALLTLDELAVPEMCDKLGIRVDSPQALAAHEAFQAHVQRGVDELNETLARYETVKRFELLPQDWTIESGEMTPTMKVKRRVVIDKFADMIEGIYARER